MVLYLFYCLGMSSFRSSGRYGPGRSFFCFFCSASRIAMGLRALRASAVIVKVMSVKNSRCIRVVAPDDHVNIGFHEVLIHDMEVENLPFVALSELNCLRQVWPKPLFVFMSRYQHDLERMRTECKELSVVLSRVIVPIVVNTFSRIWASTLPCFIWN